MTRYWYYAKDVKPDQTEENKQVVAMTSTSFDRNAEKRLFRERGGKKRENT